MDSHLNLTVHQEPLEPMDLLTRAWCNSAINEAPYDQSVLLPDNQINSFGSGSKMEGSLNGDRKPLPPWKSNDLKSWIWLQQAMHPELNYNSCFHKKWLPRKIMPFKNISIKKWLKEMKQKRKEEERLQKAEVHAAISIAGVAAALAAIAADDTKPKECGASKESAVASAAALVAAQCAQFAEAMGAKREQLSTVMGSAMTSTSASDILTLTAAAATSLRGAATLRARPGRWNRVNGSAPILPIEESDNSVFDFDKCRSVLAKGAELSIQTSDGKNMVRSVSVVLNREAKVILKIKKISMFTAFTGRNESVVLDLHAELYRDPEGEETDTSYLIVLTTNQGTIKLDMMDDRSGYTMWAMTINHMLMLSTSFTGYELQFHRC